MFKQRNKQTKVWKFEVEIEHYLVFIIYYLVLL